MARGSKAMDGGEVAEAVDCFSRRLEIQVGHYGEFSEECALSYYKYGCALLSKYQKEVGPLGDALKNTIRCTKEDKIITTVDNSGNCKGGSEEDKEDGDERSESDVEDLEEADEDESDLDLAWKMLDIAREIAEKHEGYTMKKVDILASLAENGKRNFRICLVLEERSKIEDAVLYCQRALSLCNSRFHRLKEEVEKLTMTDASNCIGMMVKEMEILGILSTDIGNKPGLSELMKMIPPSETSDMMNSSRICQMVSDTTSSDSQMVSTARTNSEVRNPRIVGRGIKRAAVTPISAEPSPKKPLLESATDKSEIGSCSGVGSKSQDSRTPSNIDLKAYTTLFG
ncbi:hypothetical protein QJS10_CPB17g02566 [Acorus calamus]|uniref:Uncharacterized protein n=1 Tax=Acorus calamus TaxID=4465 RepID=A0AAV9CVE0_ACOCL|nr:hypothetical protein QJS10_CPB17g02566 [Acorus calamus]